MRVGLELDPNQCSLTASGQGCEDPVAFHGTLELPALLETALETTPGSTTGKARK